MKKSLKNILANSSARKALVVASSGASLFIANVAMAVDDEAVAAAQTAGEGSVSAAAVGLIAIVAVGVGLAMVIGLLKKA